MTTFFLINETKIEDFFIKGLPVLRGDGKVLMKINFIKNLELREKDINLPNNLLQN